MQEMTMGHVWSWRVLIDMLNGNFNAQHRQDIEDILKASEIVTGLSKDELMMMPRSEFKALIIASLSQVYQIAEHEDAISTMSQLVEDVLRGIDEQSG